MEINRIRAYLVSKFGCGNVRRIIRGGGQATWQYRNGRTGSWHFYATEYDVTEEVRGYEKYLKTV